eukprot:15849-Heterococcus_DN1.PRE.2
MQIHIKGYKDTANSMYHHLKPQKSKLTFALSKHSSTQDKLEFLFDRVEMVARDGDHIVYLVPSINGYARLADAINREGNTVQSGIMYGHLQFGDSQYQFQEPFTWDSNDSGTDRQSNDQSSYEYKFTATAHSAQCSCFEPQQLVYTGVTAVSPLFAQVKSLLCNRVTLTSCSVHARLYAMQIPAHCHCDDR